ncbi:UNVERIFIED_ORG: phosphoribosylamine--glycine ligase [Methylobacterium sp. SuP10 SLI 274]|uniref:phosphoribosylamine--glycine ligase n=1 Tax=Methylorubrum extorquens TaxID=408 RepID=UPI0020A0F443|nr:phosphoribosylamine--glycine ligase [Methylorubrum extorquens]MDF9863805.1 phosphoribosylamine--glycine ligase [Methylorubrum pseudosasae]MDH6637404.1 phosphoribosylamine--glycine ligase [Methylobacterium sp. SuP10 SLI 274]MDH6666584.1 phosphoribosylamine--glycine ligase [Methylorubrum zatmanii]MCP1558494.1 phosphoribosylamine--glycine ligase [Methylorubrum extorquens]MDF9792122.1 phosphoribosylamine--glycine ligase [Methylorubrum extorquens]
MTEPFSILLIGSGGREHALAWAIAKSPLCTRLFIAPGNPGTAQHGENRPDLAVSDHAAVVAFCRAEGVGLVVVGPEAPLVAGLVDDLQAAGIPAFGPTKAAAQLEGSKGFTKDLCAEHDIPTAAFARFTDLEPALAYLRERGAPIVVKADGLAAGKGVTVAETLPEAEAAVRAILDGTEGGALVIEECLFGEEASFFALCDGTRAVPIGTAQDHKRVHDGDLGPNTGGMGAYSPASIVTPEITETVMTRIIAPTLAGMAARGTPFSGILYAGLMLTAEGPKLIEYNTRFGDPEAQVLMPRLTGDLVPALLAAAQGDLSGVAIGFDASSAALTVVMAAQGYPGAVTRGTEIRGVEAAEDEAGDATVLVFQAGTRRDGDRLLADGGRVLAVTALGASVGQAKDRAYAAVKRIDWPDGFFRSDIGGREVAREAASKGD